MAPNLLTPTMLLQRHLLDIGITFDTMMPKLQAFAKSPSRRRLLRAVEDAQELFISLNSHIARDRNLGHAVFNLGPIGLHLLEATHRSLFAMSNKMETRSIRSSMLNVDKGLNEICLLYLRKDVEDAETVSRKYLRRKLANCQFNLR
jgi:hypothetical protein